MSAHTLKVITLPDGISAADVESAIAELEKARQKERAERELENRILTSDAAMREWVRRTCFCDAPVVRAQVYDGENIRVSREFTRFSWTKDPRRPVIMRGALDVMIAKYALFGGYSANGYALDVFERYMRRIKFTSFDEEETREKIKGVFRALHKKFFLSYHFWKREDSYRLHGTLTEEENAEWERNYWGRLGTAPVWVWVGGKHQRLTFPQFKYLRALHTIARRTKTPEERRAIIKARMNVNKLSDDQRTELQERVRRRTATSVYRSPNYVTPWQRQKMMLRVAKELLSLQNIDIERVYEDAAREHQI